MITKFFTGHVRRAGNGVRATQAGHGVRATQAGNGVRATQAGLIAGAAVAVAAMVVGPQFAAADQVTPPDVPGTIAAPEGNVAFAAGAAEGFQIYVCQPSATSASGYGWTLQAPQAVLQGNGHKPMALHYGGPSWTAMDGSTVVATRVDGTPAPSGTTIPWLLLRVVSRSGPDGLFTPTTFIQRVNTTGGVAPATGCDADHVGSTAPVYYTADYYFYRAGHGVRATQAG